MELSYYLKKILSVLRVRPLVGGLEISDSLLHFAYFDGKVWHMGGVRLAPGVLESGKIKDGGKFREALQELKIQVFGKAAAKKRVNAVVSLSSINVYSQIFTLPIIEGENLEKAIQLNIQMVSPVEVSQAYSGWQLVGEDQKSLRLEVLSAFIDRSVVDEIVRALYEAGFVAVAIESRALALARLVREEGADIDISRPYVMLSLDNSGFDFLIIRRGQLYFQYFNSWRDLMDEKGQISLPAFEAAITRSFHQVINFYNQQWSETIQGVIISAIAFADEAKRIIIDNFSLSVDELRLKNWRDIGPEWFITLGCGLRGLKPRAEDREISLLGVGAEEEFRREQLLNFSGFWKLLVPVSLGLLVVVFYLADLFVVQTKSALESQTLFNLKTQETKEVQVLQAKVKEFNRSVALISSVEKTRLLKSKLWEKIYSLMSVNGITPNRFYFQSESMPIILTGKAESEDQIVNFKHALEGDPEFTSINLPLADIKSDGGKPSFSMTFSLNR